MAPAPDTPDRPLGFRSAASLVVASMIGAGIFTTTGFIAEDLGAAGPVLLVWGVGGLAALAGALSYAELGAMMPRAGGEYAYLARIYGPRIGFLCGFISLVAGFSAPVGGVSRALGHYLAALQPGLDPRVTGTVVIVILTAVHAFGVRFGALVNDVATGLKLALIVAFVVAGLSAGATAAPAAETADWTVCLSAPFATALVLVAFAYTGWNAAAYVGGEIRDPSRLLPRALIAGTGLVTLTYVALNVVYFRAASAAELAGVEQVGDVAARNLFGDGVASLFTSGIILLLFSTSSAFIMSGPRVTLAMARDGEMPAALGRLNRRGAPSAAVALQGALALPFVWVGALDQTLKYVGLTLSLSAGLAVLGVIVLRRRDPAASRPFRVPAYPFTPLLFVALSAWMVVFSVKDDAAPAVASAATLAAGLLVRPWLRVRPS